YLSPLFCNIHLRDADKPFLQPLPFQDLFRCADYFAACASAWEKLSTFLSMMNAVTASLSACRNAAGAASPATQPGRSLSFAKESIDHWYSILVQEFFV